MEVAPGIRRLGRGIVNVYLIEEAGEVTIIDTGVAGQWRELPTELAAMGRSLADVRAVLLTHGHSDHIGFAERMRSERGTPVMVHEADAALARGEVPSPATGAGPIRLLPMLGFLWFALRSGGLRTTPLQEVATFGAGATLDVPGSPRVVLTPGHTPGSAVLHVDALDAVFAGDALSTLAVTTGARGPQIAPYTADAELALASLDALAEIPARWVLPGHGDAWDGGTEAAVAAVRARPR